MTLRDLGLALAAVVPDCYHFEAHKQTDKYIVWAEEGQAGAGHGDNHMTTQVLTGTVDYFTKQEYDPAFGQIQQALNSMDIAWRLNSIQYEDDTKYTHYEWIWEMAVSPDG